MAGQGDHLRVVYRYFPLAMHPWARPAAEAAACAQEQGDVHFWKVHDYLFAHQRELSRDNLKERVAGYVRTLSNFDNARFTACLDERRMAKKVEQDVTFGAENGIRATPTVFVNGRQTQVVSAEQLRTLVRELSSDPDAAIPASATSRAAAVAADGVGAACTPPARSR